MSDPEWYTPRYFLELVRQVGDIVCDPATNQYNPTEAKTFFTKEEDGLVQEWPSEGLVFCNPPYGRAMGKYWAPRLCQHQGEGLWLTQSHTDTKWWSTLYEWSDWCLLWGSKELGRRISFLKPEGSHLLKRNAATFGSSVFYKGPNAWRFLQVFRPHGILIPGRHLQDTLISEAVRNL